MQLAPLPVDSMELLFSYNMPHYVILALLAFFNVVLLADKDAGSGHC